MKTLSYTVGTLPALIWGSLYIYLSSSWQRGSPVHGAGYEPSIYTRAKYPPPAPRSERLRHEPVISNTVSYNLLSTTRQRVERFSNSTSSTTTTSRSLYSNAPPLIVKRCSLCTYSLYNDLLDLFRLSPHEITSKMHTKSTKFVYSYTENTKFSVIEIDENLMSWRVTLVMR